MCKLAISMWTCQDFVSTRCGAACSCTRPSECESHTRLRSELLSHISNSEVDWFWTNSTTFNNTPSSSPFKPPPEIIWSIRWPHKASSTEQNAPNTNLTFWDWQRLPHVTERLPSIFLAVTSSWTVIISLISECSQCLSEFVLNSLQCLTLVTFGN